MIQIIGTRKCQDTKKAIRFFKERQIEHHFVDLRERALSPGELRNIMQHIPPDDLIDTASRQYEKRGLKYMKFDVEEELLEDSLLLKTPIVRTRQKAFVGLVPEKWALLIES